MKHLSPWKRYAREEKIERLLTILAGALIGCAIVAALIVATN